MAHLLDQTRQLPRGRGAVKLLRFESLLSLTLLLAWGSPRAAAQEAQQLTAGVPVTRELKGGQVYVFSFTVMDGHYLRATVEQLGVDVTLALVGENESEITYSDRAYGTRGREAVSLVSEGSRRYFLKVRARDKEPEPG
ncbi:MAG TPA: hypothetical protein VGV38_07425, partial [Pyrinomonadaceae bacterium]|nr:hypothetical protein [Pyrinomonadaceae bacterium]